jgi:putative acetyltransferase
MRIKTDDLSGPEIQALLAQHLRNMHELSPPESVHALDLAALRTPGISFWSVWSEADELMGCGALKLLDAQHGEVKSMRTVDLHRRKGVARAMLGHIIAQAQQLGLKRLSLETGSMQAFMPAQRLYESFGFEYCAPFGSYVPDPNSVFMTKLL